MGLKKLVYLIVLAGLAYLGFLFSLVTAPVQRGFIFMNGIKLGSNETLYHPETSGFAKNQVAPFWLETPDGEKLFGWHILPIDAYELNRARLRAIEPSKDEIDANELAKVHLSILREDPHARVIIYFHGNAGCISSIHRPDIYRALLTSSPAHTHLFIVDYRGFGVSTGLPSESALISDGAFVSLAITELTGIPPSKTVLVGQSLGTGVVIGIADLLLAADPPVEFKAIVPIAGFSSIEKVALDFKAFGTVPVIGPAAYLPQAQGLVSRFIQHPFRSDERLERFVRNSRRTKVLIVHSFDDAEIPFAHGERLLEAALRGASASASAEDEEGGLVQLNRYLGMAENERSGVFEVVSIAEQQTREYHFYQRFSDNGTLLLDPSSSDGEEEEGVEIEQVVKEVEQVVVPVTDEDEEVRRISMLALKWGGHNLVPKSSDVILAVRQLLYD
ncbi:Alpha/Beta hydrolase protein [Myxozyma melibiosi]|uniref:Alpha/Beta hydrolase protein n=1 Tax=Myxozyma melibiosi TaxID=54550 RepID=A0ABR1EZ08_9ASCO